MSEAESPSSEDSGGICCQSCSPMTRKCGYYITFLLGLFVFVYGIISLLSGHVYFLIGGSLMVLLCPLWVKDCKTFFSDFKNALKITSAIIFIAFLVATIVCELIFKIEWLTIVLGICLGISGIWYFLSFFPGGQKGCIECLKSCCCSEKSSS